MSSSVVELSDSDRVLLTSWTRSSTVSAGRVRRARIVLAVADGAGTSAVSAQLGLSRPTVTKWRDRFAAQGLVGLEDEPRSGRPKVVDDAAILAATLEPPPDRLAVTHWSTRLLARQLGVGDATVARAWRKYGVKPWRWEAFNSSMDPELEAKIRDVVGLYLASPENATGKITDRCYDKHGKAEFLDFMKRVARAYRGERLHFVPLPKASDRSTTTQVAAARC